MLKNLSDLGFTVFAAEPGFEFHETGRFPFRRKQDMLPEKKPAGSQEGRQEPLVSRNSCTETLDIPDQKLVQTSSES